MAKTMTRNQNPVAPSDTIPAMLTPGEFVINREAVGLLGAKNLVNANKAGLWMRARGFSEGGKVPGDGTYMTRDQFNSIHDAKPMTVNLSSQPNIGWSESQKAALERSRATDATQTLPGIYNSKNTGQTNYKPTGGGGLSVMKFGGSAPTTAKPVEQKPQATQPMPGQVWQSAVTPPLDNINQPAEPQSGLARQANSAISPVFESSRTQSSPLDMSGIRAPVSGALSNESFAYQSLKGVQGLVNGVLDIEGVQPIGKYRSQTIADVPGMRDIANRIKYPEAYAPGELPPAHGFDYQPNYVELTGPYSKIPPRSTIDAGKNLIPAQNNFPSSTGQGAYSNPAGSRPLPKMPGTGLVAQGNLNNGYAPNWTYGDPNYTPPPQTETPGFSDAAKARAAKYRAQTGGDAWNAAQNAAKVGGVADDVAQAVGDVWKEGRLVTPTKSSLVGGLAGLVKGAALNELVNSGARYVYNTLPKTTLTNGIAGYIQLLNGDAETAKRMMAGQEVDNAPYLTRQALNLVTKNDTAEPPPDQNKNTQKTDLATLPQQSQEQRMAEANRPNAPLKNGATVGSDFPEIKFDKPQISQQSKYLNANGVDGKPIYMHSDQNGQHRIDLGRAADGQMNFISSSDKAGMDRVAAGIAKRGYGVKQGTPLTEDQRIQMRKDNEAEYYAGKERERQDAIFNNMARLQSIAMDSNADPISRQAAMQGLQHYGGLYGHMMQNQAAQQAHADQLAYRQQDKQEARAVAQAKADVDAKRFESTYAQKERELNQKSNSSLNKLYKQTDLVNGDTWVSGRDILSKQAKDTFNKKLSTPKFQDLLKQYNGDSDKLFNDYLSEYLAEHAGTLQD